jgi:hypothetical protein
MFSPIDNLSINHSARNKSSKLIGEEINAHLYKFVDCETKRSKTQTAFGATTDVNSLSKGGGKLKHIKKKNKQNYI